MSNIHIVRNYYSDIDANDINAACSIFATNAVYIRGTQQPLKGFDAIVDFYQNHRIIQSGNHIVPSIRMQNDTVFASGFFNGVLKDGNEVEVFFLDEFRFVDKKVVLRITKFENREV